MDDSESNPFVLFRRFADEQLARALKTFKEPWAPFQEIHKDNSFQDRQNEIWKRFEQSFQRAMNPERRQIERLDHGEAEQHTMPSLIQVAEDTGHGTERNRELENEWNEFTLAEQEWTLRWFDESLYSPLRLEQDPTLCKINWRNAFEDLLHQDDTHSLPNKLQPVKDRDSLLDQMSGGAWKNSLLQRGLLLNHWFWRDTFTDSPFESILRTLGELHGSNQAQSELEFYELISQRDRQRDTAVQASHAEAQEAGIPSIISSLTRTEHRMMKDGSIQSRTILRQRFADGTEECQETSDATPLNTTLSGNVLAKEKAPKPTREIQGGWFW